jgi:hypothetical protein
MGNNLDYQDLLDDTDSEPSGPWSDELPRNRPQPGKERDVRRTIEELKEKKRLRELLSDYEFDDED